MPRKKSTFDVSARVNKLTYNYYYNRLLELSVSMFDWKNLPDSIDPRFLELALFQDGLAVFFWDEDMEDYLALRCAAGGKLNVYNIPTERRAYAAGGYHKNLTIDNSVIIYNNYIHTNAVDTVDMFANKLWDLDLTVQINCKAQKTPALIKCSETQRLSLLNAYQKYDGNQPVIFADKDFNTDALTVLKTDAPYVADKIYQLKCDVWNEALTYLGIPNVNTQKRERLISDEVERQQGGTMASKFSRLNARKDACKQINKMFGLNIDVEYREGIEADLSVPKGGEENG